MNTIERFELAYLHDSGVMSILIDVQRDACRLALDRAGVLRKDPQTIFDRERNYEPAVLEFVDVKLIKMPDGYPLNDVIAAAKCVATELPDYFCFSLDLMGGRGDEFMRTIEIVAKDFSLSGTPVALPTVDA